MVYWNLKCITAWSVSNLNMFKQYVLGIKKMYKVNLYVLAVLLNLDFNDVLLGDDNELIKNHL